MRSMVRTQIRAAVKDVPHHRQGPSVAGRLSAVDVQDLTGDERGAFEVEDAVDDVVDLAEPSKRMKTGEAVVHEQLTTPRRCPAERRRPTRSCRSQDPFVYQTSPQQ